MSLSDLSDNKSVVLVAYLCVFVPWTAVASLDFISAQWKSVRDSRHDAQYHLFFVIAPTFYIMFYIIVQATAEDFKEMSAAIVALIFSLHHVARTVWAIAQLSAFRTWAAESILALRENGIEYKSVFASCHGKSALDIADELLINEEVVDNQLLHGSPRCYVMFGDLDLRVGVNTQLYGPYRILQQLFSRIINFTLILYIPFHMVLSYVLEFFSMRRWKMRRIRQRPVEPVNLWLTWATVFVAQGLSHWVSEFSIASDDRGISDFDLRALFAARRNYFAAEVLASAVMHASPPTSPDISDPYPNPFSLLEWSVDSDTAHGRMTKEDLLSLALADGCALPYGEPHRRVLASSGHSSGRIGYDSYSIKLQRVTEGMPDLFGISVLDFDIEKLEWLSILLTIGFKSLDRKGCRLTDQISSAPIDKTSDSSNRPLPEKPMPALQPNDLALQNLYVQLGFPQKLQSPEDSLDLLARCSFPFSIAHLTTISDSNRLVLRCGEYIDAWLALLAGDDVNYLQRHDKFWRGVYDPQEKTNKEFERDGFYRSFPTLRKYHHELELRRINYQFSQASRHDHHCQHTLSFMGYSMEIVRTLLSRWASRNLREANLDWTLPEGESASSSQALEIGFWSESLSRDFVASDASTQMATKKMQTCILAEAQALCRSLCFSGEDQSTALVILAIISFPSVRMKLQDGANVIVNQQSLSCGVQLSASASPKESQWTIEVIPAGAPQDFRVHFSATLVEDLKKMKVSASLHWNCSTGETPLFKWQTWRDAFFARLEGHAKWLANHGFPKSSLLGTDCPISRGVVNINTPMRGTGDQFELWNGWKPFRPDIARFEVEYPGFLLQTDTLKSFFSEHYSWIDEETTTGYFPYHERGIVSYSSADRGVLRHACLIVKEELEKIGEGEHIPTFEPSRRNVGEIVRLAQVIQSRGDGERETERQLFLLEIGVAEHGSLPALEMCVDLLVDLPFGVSRATLILKRYLSYLERQSCNTVELIEERMEALKMAIGIFEKLLSSDDLSATVLPTFTAFVGMVPDLISQSDKMQSLRCKLRRAFMHCRDSSLITNLAHISLSRQRPWEKQGAEYVLRNVSRGGNCSAVVNIKRVRDYFPWEERCGVTLKRLYLERASLEEGNNQDALMNLAQLSQNPPHGIERDWERAYSLYERALQISYRPDALYFQGVMLKDGGYGLQKDEEMALARFDKAKTEGFHDRPFVAYAILRLEDTRTGPDEQTLLLNDLKEIVPKTKSPLLLYNTAVMLQKGSFGLTRERSQAESLFEAKSLLERSMDLGYEGAAIRLVTHYYSDDTGRSADLAKAAEVYCRAIVEKHSVDCFSDLGTLVRYGNGVFQDGQLAVNLFESGMQLGNDSCASQFIGMQAFGSCGLRKDPYKAVLLSREFLRFQPSRLVSQILGLILIHSIDADELKEGIELMESDIAQEKSMKSMFALASVLENENLRDTFNGERAHELYNEIVREVSQIDGVIFGDREDGAMHALAAWHRQPEIQYKISWAAAVMFWNAVPSEYPQAVSKTARNFFEGKFVDKDIPRARDLWQKAIKLSKWSNAGSKYRLGETLLTGRYGCRQDVRRGLDLLVEGAKNGDESFKLTCAHKLVSAEVDVEKNAALGIEMLEDIISTIGDGDISDTHSGACRTFAEWILDGKAGLEPDVKRARHLLDIAIEKGNDQYSMGILGRCLRFGTRGFEPDPTSSAEFFKKSFNRNQNPMATFEACLHLTDLLIHFKEPSFVEQTTSLLNRISTVYRNEDPPYFRMNKNDIDLKVVGDREQLARDQLEGNGSAAVDARKAFELLDDSLQQFKDLPMISSSEYMLASLLIIGPIGVPRDMERAKELLTKYASTSNAPPTPSISLCSSLLAGRDIESELDPPWKLSVKVVGASEQEGSSSTTPHLVSVTVCLEEDIMESGEVVTTPPAELEQPNEEVCPPSAEPEESSDVLTPPPIEMEPVLLRGTTESLQPSDGE